MVGEAGGLHREGAKGAKGQMVGEAGGLHRESATGAKGQMVGEAGGFNRKGNESWPFRPFSPLRPSRLRGESPGYRILHYKRQCNHLRRNLRINTLYGNLGAGSAEGALHERQGNRSVQRHAVHFTADPADLLRRVASI